MRSLIRMLAVLATVGHVANGVAFADDTASANANAPAAVVAPGVVEMHRERAGSVSFRVGNTWPRLNDSDEAMARLQFVANLREVLDAAPDVPPGSFEQVAAFRAYAIPEIGGYLLASVVRVQPYPVQLFDVLHMHARGRNDWGESLYLHVDEVLRSDRFELFQQPAIAVDVNMSDQYHLASIFLRVPGNEHFIGGLVFLVPSTAWQSFAPTIETVRASLRLTDDPVDSDSQEGAIEEEWIEETKAADEPADEEIARVQQMPTWEPPRPDGDPGEGVRLVVTRVTVIAVSYAITFFLTLRIIYMGLLTIGAYFLPAPRIEQYRQAAAENPWTLGLLKSEGMIMLCAILSMALAAMFLGLVVRI